MQNDYSSSALQSQAAGFDLVEMHDCFAIARDANSTGNSRAARAGARSTTRGLALPVARAEQSAAPTAPRCRLSRCARDQAGLDRARVEADCRHRLITGSRAPDRGARASAGLMRAMCASAQSGTMKILTIIHTRPLQSAMASRRNCRGQADRRHAVPVRRTRTMASGRGDRVKGA